MVCATDSLSLVFAALADPTRRAILARLAEGRRRVTELAEPFDMSLPAVSKHLKVLERAGLLRRDVFGRTHECRLDAARMKMAAEWVSRYRAFWEQQFASLERFLAEQQSSAALARPNPKKRKEKP